MTKIEKIIERLLSNPKSLKLSEIEKILSYFGCDISSGKGSHRKVTHKEKGIVYIYPVHGNDIAPVYKERIAKIYKQYFTH